MNHINFQHYSFEHIPSAVLYQSLKLRSDIFVVEQQCIYPDLDNKDCVSGSEHIVGTLANSDSVGAYARCLPPNVSYPGCSIGRVAVAKELRGSGVARALMQYAIGICQQQWPTSPIEIGAQLYLQDFYASLGFAAFGQPYDEDGIMHIDMRHSR